MALRMPSRFSDFDDDLLLEAALEMGLAQERTKQKKAKQEAKTERAKAKALKRAQRREERGLGPSEPAQPAQPAQPSTPGSGGSIGKSTRQRIPRAEGTGRTPRTPRTPRQPRQPGGLSPADPRTSSIPADRTQRLVDTRPASSASSAPSGGRSGGGGGGGGRGGRRPPSGGGGAKKQPPMEGGLEALEELVGFDPLQNERFRDTTTRLAEEGKIPWEMIRNIGPVGEVLFEDVPIPAEHLAALGGEEARQTYIQFNTELREALAEKVKAGEMTEDEAAKAADARRRKYMERYVGEGTGTLPLQIPNPEDPQGDPLDLLIPLLPEYLPTTTGGSISGDAISGGIELGREFNPLTNPEHAEQRILDYLSGAFLPEESDEETRRLDTEAYGNPADFGPEDYQPQPDVWERAARAGAPHATHAFRSMGDPAHNVPGVHDEDLPVWRRALMRIGAAGLQGTQ